MRSFLVATLLVLLSQPAWSEAKSIDRDEMEGSYTIRTICVDGYKFVVANRLERKSVSSGVVFLDDLAMVQFYERRNGVAVPSRCDA